MPERYTLNISAPGHSLKTLDLESGAYRIGCLPVCEIVLDGSNVSNLHAVLCLSADGNITLQDNHSKTGTFLSGRSIFAEGPVSVGEHEPITIAEYSLTVQFSVPEIAGGPLLPVHALPPPERHPIAEYSCPKCESLLADHGGRLHCELCGWRANQENGFGAFLSKAFDFLFSVGIFIGIAVLVAHIIKTERSGDDSNSLNPFSFGTATPPGELGLHTSSSPGPEVPDLVAGRDFEYSLGSGFGHVKFRAYGTHLPLIQQKYFADKGPYLANEFKKLTGFGLPNNFHYVVNYYLDRDQYVQTVGPTYKETGGVCYWQSDTIISTIHATGNVDTVTHEMMHAIAHAAYGSLPLFMDEGMAEWFATHYRKRTPDSIHFYKTSAEIATQAARIHQGQFPSMASYLQSESYDDWKQIFGGDYFKGYPVGAILTDWLLRNHHSWTIEAMRYCHENGTSKAERSRLFAKYVDNTWRGGYADMDRQLRAYILKRASEYGR